MIKDSKKILDGKALSILLNDELKQKIQTTYKNTGLKPKLAAIMVGDNPASEVYVRIKRRTCDEVGIESTVIKLEENCTIDELKETIKQVNNDNTIHGIILQQPLPERLRPYVSFLVELISPDKDVDGFHPLNRGKLFDYIETLAPCTPKGIIKLLDYYGIELKGKNVAIINRSNLVGKPLIFMLLKRNATITICHTSTIDLERHCKQADILIVAVGKPKFITKNMIKNGAIIIDVGQSRVEGKLIGDVDFDDVYEKCGMITPSPGGVGPLTVSFLLQNTYITFQTLISKD